MPPNSSPTAYDFFGDSVIYATSTCNNVNAILITGDFNLPRFDWCNPVAADASPSVKAVLDLASHLDLTQISGVLNSRGVQLDLVFGCPGVFSVSLADDTLIANEEYHPGLAITASLTGYSRAPTKTPSYIRNTKRPNLEAVKNDLKNGVINLDRDCTDVDSAFSSFCTQLSDCIRFHTPWKRIGLSAFPRWFSKELKDLVVLKKSLHRQYKESHDHIAYERFCRVRAHCKVMARDCRSRYIGHVNSTISSNVKVFWSFLKQLDRTSVDPSVMGDGTTTTSRPDEMCELFASYFSSVYSPSTHIAYTPLADKTSFVLASCSVSAIEIDNKLMRLDSSKSCGPDEVTPGVLKYHSELVSYLHFLFNLSLEHGIFPAVLKWGYVIPIFKSGDRQMVTNYRPMS
ncbi:uncharacterized protein LOC128989358 [Macrosteles quadrilineatus]|uniref:uncharacterized protein LOC128989358 n=1 Tax=Macrosteles quadrilineatus TaxID=74068 RepID=UPI0023E100F4|nr:uncharacterized protein LOC128989358 [Macrosteles quadrilineatus]